MGSHVRVGIIGGGMIAKAHAIAFRAQRSYFGADEIDAEIVAVADANEAAARNAAHTYSIAKWTADWEQLISDDGIDVVTIATPNDTHLPVAAAAARHGKHVLCEKPLASSLSAARKMVDEVESAGVVNSVNLNYRCVPAVRYARALIEHGELGEITGFRGAFLQGWGADPRVSRSWKFERGRAGAGPMLSVGCHVVDLARYLIGEISEVVASTRTWITERPLQASRDTYAVTQPGTVPSAPVDVEDLGCFLLRFGNGALGTIDVSRIASGRENHCFIEINGTAGSVVFDYDRMNELQVATGKAGPGFRRVLVGPEQDGGLFWTLGGLGVGFAETMTLHVHEFLKAVASGGGANPSFRDGMRAQEVVDAALESARTGAWQPVSALDSKTQGDTHAV